MKKLYVFLLFMSTLSAFNLHGMETPQCIPSAPPIQYDRDISDNIFDGLTTPCDCLPTAPLSEHLPQQLSMKEFEEHIDESFVSDLIKFEKEQNLENALWKDLKSNLELKEQLVQRKKEAVINETKIHMVKSSDFDEENRFTQSLFTSDDYLIFIFNEQSALNQERLNNIISTYGKKITGLTFINTDFSNLSSSRVVKLLASLKKLKSLIFSTCTNLYLDKKLILPELDNFTIIGGKIDIFRFNNMGKLLPKATNIVIDLETNCFSKTPTLKSLPENLKVLQLSFYNFKSFSKEKFIALKKLKKITLHQCKKVKQELTNYIQYDWKKSKKKRL